MSVITETSGLSPLNVYYALSANKEDLTVDAVAALFRKTIAESSEYEVEFKELGLFFALTGDHDFMLHTTGFPDCSADMMLQEYSGVEDKFDVENSSKLSDFLPKKTDYLAQGKEYLNQARESVGMKTLYGTAAVATVATLAVVSFAYMRTR